MHQSMKFVSIALGAFIFLFFAQSADAQSLPCLSYQSTTTPGSLFAPAFDAFDGSRNLLIKSTCPSSGNTITITVGRNDPSEIIWGKAQVYISGAWQERDLTGVATTSYPGWLQGQGTLIMDAPQSGTRFFFAGYMCTDRSGTWKCGCSDVNCTVSKWHIQAFKIPDTIPPSVPSGLRSTSVSSTTIALSWNTSTDNRDTVSYRILRNGNVIATTTQTTYTDSSLNFDTAYRYTVSAYDGAANQSAASSELATRTLFRSGLPWRSGSSPGTSDGTQAAANTKGFGDWRGRPDDVGVIFIGNNAWTSTYASFLTNQVLRSDGALKGLLDADIIPVMTVPLVVCTDEGKFSMVASGAIDASHTAIADKIASVTQGRLIYLRLGHEADSGYPWSYTAHAQTNTACGTDTQPDPAIATDYVAAWRRIAAIYHSHVPGAKLVWNVLKNTRQKITDYYPGDDVVDVLSVDIYDNGSGGWCNSATSSGWLNFCLGSFNSGAGTSKGVNGLLQFATSRGKKIAVDEWGVVNSTHTATNTANGSFFVAGMYDFFAAHSSSIEYESYYNRAGGGDHQIWPKTDYNPLPSDAYLDRYSE